MSEHMANMNDKLAAQQEEIEQLNYELTAKVFFFISFVKNSPGNNNFGFCF